MLHNNKELFEQVILRTSDDMGITPAIVEKDYYVTLFLREIVNVYPNIIFKGGTSLSKCHKLIHRFSEDIDLNINTENKPTEGQRKKLKEAIVSVIDSLGFTLTNSEDVRSRRSYNKYIVDYDTVFGTQYLKENLIVETSVYIRAYPSVRMNASSFIHDYLKNSGFDNLIEEYGLHPFELNVQSKERTLIDKVFALGDYYLDNKLAEHSRHMYDLYKLSEVVELNSDMRHLANEVAEERRRHHTCLSAQSGVDIKTLIQEIMDKDIYKNDYETITSGLLFEEVTYSEAKDAVRKIINSGVFDMTSLHD